MKKRVCLYHIMQKGNYASQWKCFAEISGDSCTTMIGPNFNEDLVMSRQNENEEREN